MIKSKWISVVTALAMSAVLLCTGFAIANPDALAAISAKRTPPYVSKMDKTQILNVEIEVSESDWNNMIENASNLGIADSKTYIPANVIINGYKINNVAIRPKGNSSLSAALSGGKNRFSLKIEFDHYIKGQTWLGLDKLCLNNIYSDPSYMKEFLSYDMMDYMGVATPAYAFTDISVNGEAFGFYLAVEAIEDSFTQRYYGNDYGKLYKPDRINALAQNVNGPEVIQGPQGYGNMPNDRQLHENKGFQPETTDGKTGLASALVYVDEDISSYETIFENAVFDSTNADYQRVITALRSLNSGTDLETYIDVDAVLRYLAAHTVVVNIDSYVSAMLHNYYLHEKEGKLTILPWDYNEAFGAFGSLTASKTVNFPIDSPLEEGIKLSDRPLIGKLFEVPEYLEKYHQYLREIVGGYFNSGVFEQTYNNTETLIDSFVKTDPNPFYSYNEYLKAVRMLRELITLRAKSVESQLDGTIPSTWEEQKKNTASLIDTSSIDMNALGGTVGGGPSKIMIKGVEIILAESDVKDFDILIQAIDIIESADGEELSEQKYAELLDLGLGENQIARLCEAIRNPAPNNPNAYGQITDGRPVTDRNPGGDGKQPIITNPNGPNMPEINEPEQSSPKNGN